MLKVAIVGCGKIADSHASQIELIDGCEMCGAVDSEELMARQLCDRFAIKRPYRSLDDLLTDAKPDVVHITTPPQSHLDIGRECLRAGCNIYVEKPFTVNETEAKTLLDLAERYGRKLTVGHDEQFSAVAMRMRKLCAEGYLGGAPLHIESTWCYELGDDAYSRALLMDRKHWVRSLPGQLLQNTISHGVAKVAEFFRSEDPDVVALGFVSPFLASLGDTGIIDELRVIIHEESGTTAYFTFSSQIRPSLHQLRIFGPLNSIVLDEDQQMLFQLRGNRYKSYAEKFLPPLDYARQSISNLSCNLRLFFTKRFHANSGKRHLIEAFYHSITDGAEVPITYREILLTSRIMDKIFAQLHGSILAQSPRIS